MSENIKWEDVDWTQNNAVLAELLGCSYNIVRYNRIRLKKPSLGRGRPVSTFDENEWKDVDWTKSSREISLSLNRPYSAVREARKLLGKDGHGRKHYRQLIVDINSIDWSDRDAEIARKQGVTRERVRQIRNKLHKSRSEFYHQHSVYVDTVKWLRENRESVEGLRLIDIKFILPINANYPTIRKACERLGVKIGEEKRYENLTKENLHTYVKKVQTEFGECWEFDTENQPRMRGRPAHRVIYEMFYKPIRRGCWVIRKCRNVRCVNPDHLLSTSVTESLALNRVRPITGKRIWTDQEVAELRDRYQRGGISILGLSKELSVPFTTVYNMLKGHNYKS